MRKFSKSLAIVILLIMSNSINAQWFVLPNPPNLIIGENHCWQITASEVILPYGDNKIAYSSYCSGSPSIGGSVYMGISKDDLLSSILVFTNATGAGMGLMKLHAYNDSTFSYFIYEDGSAHFCLSQNMFNSKAELFPYTFPNPFSIGTAITANYVYVFGYVDSLRILRSGRIGANYGTRTITKYIPAEDKLNFINDSVGFTLAYFNSNISKKTLIKITDYGFTWTPVLIDSIDAIVDYHISDQGNIYVLKKSGTVFKSSDEGSTFSALTSAPAGIYTCIHFANDTSGFIGGANGVLLKTRDGGHTWTSETSNTTQQINSIYMFNNNISYFVDAKNKVYKSQQPLGVTKKFESSDESFVFPSPASHELTIKYNSKTGNGVRGEITDLSGRIMMKSEFVNEINLDVSDLSDGVYIVRIVENNRITKTQKLLISK